LDIVRPTRDLPSIVRTLHGIPRVSEQDVMQDLGEIGRGSFGRVYRSRVNGNPVAVKEYLLTHKRTFFHAALHEIRVMHRLNHRNVLRCKGWSFDGERKVLRMVMPLMRLSLEERFGELHEGTVPPNEAMNLARDIARGMYHLHVKHLTHCDLAARNILLNNNGTAVVADLGISRVLHHLDSASWPVMSLRASVRPPSARREDFVADIRSYGYLVWRILHPDQPYMPIGWSHRSQRGACGIVGRDHRRASAHLPIQVPPMREMAPEGVRVLQTVVRRCLSDEQPPTFGDILTMFEEPKNKSCRRWLWPNEEYLCVFLEVG